MRAGRRADEGEDALRERAGVGSGVGLRPWVTPSCAAPILIIPRITRPTGAVLRPRDNRKKLGEVLATVLQSCPDDETGASAKWAPKLSGSKYHAGSVVGNVMLLYV